MGDGKKGLKGKQNNKCIEPLEAHIRLYIKKEEVEEKKKLFFSFRKIPGPAVLSRDHPIALAQHRLSSTNGEKSCEYNKKKSKKTFFSSSFIVYIYRGKFLYVKLFSRNHFSTCRVISQGNVRPPQLTPL